MIKTDFHTHTAYCDGKNTPEEMILAAIEKGMTDLGFSGHAHTSFDDSWCMSESGMKEYVSELKQLKEKYADKIKIHIGTEWDIFSSGDKEPFEYIIGSAHYIERNKDTNVDDSPEKLLRIRDDFFQGDMYALCESYYENLKTVIDVTGADIIGHFDLVTKFNENGRMFDTQNERYKKAWKEAADTLLKTGKLFEINTGAMSRGYRTKPYPSEEIIDYLGGRGATFILSSDSHSTAMLLYGFEDAENFIKKRGYALAGNLF